MLSKPLVKDLIFNGAAFGTGKRKLIKFICVGNYVIPYSDGYVTVEKWVVGTVGNVAKKEKFIFVVGASCGLLESDKGKNFCWEHHLLCVSDADFTPPEIEKEA